MYYQGLPANGSPSVSGQGVEKPGIYIPAQSPYGPPGATAFAAPGQPALPPGLAPRYAAAPQAYAVVSNASPSGYTTISPAYHSLPYSGLQGIPTTSHAYISAGQYPPGALSYQTAVPPRTAPPSPYPAPVQAGAPLIATGYSPMPGAIPGAPPNARSFTLGAVAAYPPGYPHAAATSSVPYGGPYGPPF